MQQCTQAVNARVELIASARPAMRQTVARQLTLPWRACSCIVDKKPQHMDLNRASILCNIAELVTREIEADWAAAQQRLTCMSLLRTMDSYKQAFMFVDVAVPGWRVLYMNEHAVERTGAHRKFTACLFRPAKCHLSYCLGKSC